MSAKPRPAGAYQFLYRGQIACGVGASASDLASKPTAQCGLGFTILPYTVTEFGIMGPQAHRSYLSGYLSEDVVVLIAPKGTRHWDGHPIVLAGYTRMFETGHSLDYGVGFEKHINQDHSLQLEIRDYYTFANPIQHNVMLRAVWMLGVPD